MRGDALVTHLVTHLPTVRHRKEAQKAATLRAMVTHGDALLQEKDWKGIEEGREQGARRGAREGAGDHNAKSASPCVTTLGKNGRYPPRSMVTHGDAHVRHHGTVTLAEVVARIVERAERLRAPCHRDPHAFHDDKGELVGALRDLQRRVGSAGP